MAQHLVTVVHDDETDTIQFIRAGEEGRVLLALAIPEGRVASIEDAVDTLILDALFR